MKKGNLVLGIVDLAVWYVFTLYLLYALKSIDVNLWIASLVIVVLGAVGTFLCPWFQSAEGWRKMNGGRKGE